MSFHERRPLEAWGLWPLFTVAFSYLEGWSSKSHLSSHNEGRSHQEAVLGPKAHRLPSHHPVPDKALLAAE